MFGRTVGALNKLFSFFLKTAPNSPKILNFMLPIKNHLYLDNRVSTVHPLAFRRGEWDINKTSSIKRLNVVYLDLDL